MDAGITVKDDRVVSGEGVPPSSLAGVSPAGRYVTQQVREGKMPSRRAGETPASLQLLDITVLMGGPSSEREVSIQTGSAISDALRRLGHSVTQSDISPANLTALDREGMDLVFIALHGAFGEDGQVQAVCEERHLRYVGSPPSASSKAMDKAASKEVFRRAGIATPDWAVVTIANMVRMHGRLEELGLPAVVKPIDGGSSVDVTIARDPAARDQAVAACVAKYGRALVERFVSGKEVTVGVLGRQVLPVIEIRPAHAFYDYEAKYTDCGTQYIFDHGLGESVVAALGAEAMAAHDALGCRDLSRVDFIVDARGVAHLLEINTIPGFTSHSLLPMAARRAGIGFDQLVARLVEMAMRRGPQREKVD